MSNIESRKKNNEHMKTVCRIIAIGLMMIIFSGVTADAQRRKAPPPEDIIGRDLESVKQIYQRAIRAGDASFTIHYAEALFFAGLFDEAVKVYAEADSLELITESHQKRNYVHAALRSGKKSPYMVDSGHFSREWEARADIRPFCSNSPNEDFAPYFWNDILFITSSRDMATTGRYDFTNKPFLNVHAFISNCISIAIPPILPQDINTAMHDGPIAISRDGSMVVVTRNYQRPTARGLYNLYLDFYQRKDDKWSSSKMFTHISTEYSVQHPYYSDHDSILYFSSNMPGGFGGFDLYSSRWDGQSWSMPQNLGPEVNTEYDEVFPSFTPQGHLIYASNHIETYGGMDMVLFHNGSRYLLPEPFNTVYDDFAITFKDETSGYFTSNRDRTTFNDDIFTFDIPAFSPPLYEFLVEVLDHHSGEPVEGVEVKFLSMAARAQGLVHTSAVGMAPLGRGAEVLYDYSFELNHPDYDRKSVFSGDFKERDGRYVITLTLTRKRPQVADREMISRGFFVVYFDNDQPDPRSGRADTDLSYDDVFRAYMLRKPDFFLHSVNDAAALDSFFAGVEQGMEDLEAFAAFLQEELNKGRHVTVVFTSHASPLASMNYNMLLSQRRFVSVMNFLYKWQGGLLVPFLDAGMLTYTNNPFGATQAAARVSDSREDPARSIYSVAASRERRVTISWRSSNGPATGKN